jgi:hypothetical protein
MLVRVSYEVSGKITDRRQAQTCMACPGQELATLLVTARLFDFVPVGRFEVFDCPSCRRRFRRVSWFHRAFMSSFLGIFVGLLGWGGAYAAYGAVEVFRSPSPSLDMAGLLLVLTATCAGVGFVMLRSIWRLWSRRLVAVDASFDTAL